MANDKTFVLLDDAQSGGNGRVQLFSAPHAHFVARRSEDVLPTLLAADKARQETGGTLAGMIAYEAGLALEPRLEALTPCRTGAHGPLVWLGLFDKASDMSQEELANWLEEQGGNSHASIGPLDPQISRGAYDKMFGQMMEAIHAGDIYQANLTLPLAGSYRGNPVALYRALRDSAKAPYSALIFDGSHYTLSFSPELFAETKQGEIRAKPMKGTRPRGACDASDAALRQELAGSPKDRAENLMIVDLIRNDLSRTAAPGSVKVEAPFAVETYPSVHQMVTTVEARLDEGRGAIDLIRALFPCGSITGAPKIRAMELIQKTERDPRGIYCGAIGKIDGNGDASFNVAIRTMRLTPIENERGKAMLGIGSAIVADSEADDEWRECQIKGGFVRQTSPTLTAAQFDLIETMRFDPEAGIELLEMHLERMKASAEELGFSFDRHQMRNKIQALCFELEKSATVRLMLARSGASSLMTGPLPEARSEPIGCIALPHPLDAHDWRLCHKTSDRGFYNAARDAAQHFGADEAILVRDGALITEGSWTSVFVKRGDIFLTPPASLGLLPGVFRRSLLDAGKAKEAELTLDDLAGGFFLGNALRGLMSAQILPSSPK